MASEAEPASGSVSFQWSGNSAEVVSLTHGRELLGSLPSLRPALPGRTATTRKVDRLSCVRFGSARYSVPTRLIGSTVRTKHRVPTRSAAGHWRCRRRGTTSGATGHPHHVSCAGADSPRRSGRSTATIPGD
jgi:hypothetical protein